MMIRDALKLMAETYVEDGMPLPKPNPKARDKTAQYQERIALEFQTRVLALA
jgi:hypothetical protein